MKEKKLTDEEIVKALDICYSTPCCTNECPYFNKNGRNFCLEGKAFYKNLKDLINRQKAEIERLTEENEYLDMCGKQFFADSQSLQVQVDELKANQVIECHGMLKGCDMVKQAVKDTAKEILQGLVEKAYLNGCIDLTVNEVKAWFREDYGVEVE